MTRVQALQLLGLKVGASAQQITDSYHKQHPAAEAAAKQGKGERLARLDEAYRLLLMENDPETQRQAAGAPDKPGVDGAKFAAEHERIKNAKGSVNALWLLILLGGLGFLAAWWLKLIPGLPSISG